MTLARNNSPDATIYSRNLLKNKYGSYYVSGRPFTADRWVTIMDIYKDMVAMTGKCSIRQLAVVAGVSRTSAKKAIEYHEKGTIDYLPRGTKRKGIGSLIGFKPEHHAYIYELYSRKPSRPRDVYVSKLQEKFNISVSQQFISDWFKTIGPFKGNLRETSLFPPDKESPRVQKLRDEYMDFIKCVQNHRKIVFADEKPMKEQDLFSLVRRDPITGIVPTNKGKANSKNRWNILSAITVKAHSRAVESLIFEECTDACLFLQFVGHLIEVGTLASGDIFVVDNCSIHMHGENKHLQENLFNDLGILKVPLPPYHPELNPTELVFNTLVQRMRSNHTRSSSKSNKVFLKKVITEIEKFSRDDAKSFYKKCVYNL